MADMTYLLLISGFIFLVKGADIFVDGSAALAQKFSIPPLIIGLTIVSFGYKRMFSRFSIPSNGD